MNLHYDKETGMANEVIEGYIANSYKKAIGRITTYLSLELAQYKMDDAIPNDVFDKAHKFIEEVRDDFINNTLMDDFSNKYINMFDYKQIYKSFNESIGQLEDIYLYRTIYRKSKFHLEFGVEYEKYNMMIE